MASEIRFCWECIVNNHTVEPKLCQDSCDAIIFSKGLEANFQHHLIKTIAQRMDLAILR